MLESDGSININEDLGKPRKSRTGDSPRGAVFEIVWWEKNFALIRPAPVLARGKLGAIGVGACVLCNIIV